MIEVGKKLVGIDNYVPSEPSERPAIILVLEIIGVKDHGKGESLGAKAKDESGDVWECHWTCPDTSGSPFRTWYCTTDLEKYKQDKTHDVRSLWDITYVRYIPSKPLFLNEEKFNKLLHYCPIHMSLQYKDGAALYKKVFATSENPCFFCYLENLPDRHESNKDKKYFTARPWNGWY